jgi:hypothetical protein
MSAPEIRARGISEILSVVDKTVVSLRASSNWTYQTSTRGIKIMKAKALRKMKRRPAPLRKAKRVVGKETKSLSGRKTKAVKRMLHPGVKPPPGKRK